MKEQGKSLENEHIRPKVIREIGYMYIAGDGKKFVDEEEAEPTGMMQQAMSQIKDVGTEEVLPEPIQEKMSLLAPRGEQ